MTPGAKGASARWSRDSTTPGRRLAPARRPHRILTEKLDASQGRATQREGRIRTLAQRLDDSRKKTARREGRIRILTEKLDASQGRVTQREGRIRTLAQRLDDSRKKTARREDRIRIAGPRRLDDFPEAKTAHAARRAHPHAGRRDSTTPGRRPPGAKTASASSPRSSTLPGAKWRIMRSAFTAWSDNSRSPALDT